MTCSVDGCDKGAKKRGLCVAHYERLKAHGDPLGGGTPNGAPLNWLKEHADYAGDDCLKWLFGSYPNGYGAAHIEGKAIVASRAMCIMAHGEPPTAEHQAAHSCGNGHLGCVNPKHLRWATCSGNLMDRVAHNTHNRGERHHGAKLTEADVIAIRNTPSTFSSKHLASLFNVSIETIYRIRRGASWSWLEEKGKAA